MTVIAYNKFKFRIYTCSEIRNTSELDMTIAVSCFANIDQNNYIQYKTHSLCSERFLNVRMKKYPCYPYCHENGDISLTTTAYLHFF